MHFGAHPHQQMVRNSAPLRRAGRCISRQPPPRGAAWGGLAPRGSACVIKGSMVRPWRALGASFAAIAALRARGCPVRVITHLAEKGDGWRRRGASNSARENGGSGGCYSTRQNLTEQQQQTAATSGRACVARQGALQCSRVRSVQPHNKATPQTTHLPFHHNLFLMNRTIYFHQH